MKLFGVKVLPVGRNIKNSFRAGFPTNTKHEQSSCFCLCSTVMSCMEIPYVESHQFFCILRKFKKKAEHYLFNILSPECVTLPCADNIHIYHNLFNWKKYLAVLIIFPSKFQRCSREMRGVE